jgi:hypothetical protein
VLGGEVNRIGGHASFFVGPEGMTRIRVRIEPWVVRGGHENPDAVPLVEDRARKMPSVTSIDRPSGYTSASMAVKSVSGQSDEMNSSARILPVTSSGSCRASELKTKTSFRNCRGRRSAGPIGGMRFWPPNVGTGSAGS